MENSEHPITTPKIDPICLLLGFGAAGVIVLAVWALGGFTSFAVFLLFVLWLILGYWFSASCSESDGGSYRAVFNALYVPQEHVTTPTAITDERVVSGGALPSPKAAPAARITPPPKSVPQPEASVQDASASAGSKPKMLTAADDRGSDDLTRIKGVGPKLAKMLNDMGIYHFDQIASWSEAELAWVDDSLGSFRGRASRDDWIAQAKELATPG